MRIQEPFLFPFKRLKKSFSFMNGLNDAWFYLLNRLMAISQDEQLISIISQLCPFNLSNHLEASNKLIKEQYISHLPFSLNEGQSSTHLTPFHLSFYSEPNASAKQKGQYFTPSYISDFIVKKSLKYLLSSKSNPSELFFGDIACGSGNLLIPLLNQLYNLSLNELNTEDFINFISINIYGFDTDPISLWISKIRILLYLACTVPDFSPSTVNLNLFNSDALQSLQIDRNKEIDEAFFDLIVLNPPYMNYGLRNAQKYDKEFKNFLRNRFFSAEYKLSLYPIFMERSIELLKDKGILGIITPDSHLLGRFYSKIRSYLLQNTNILDISLLGFEPFSGATLGRPTITFLKKTNIPPKRPFPARWIPSFSSFIDEDWEEYSNSQNNFSDNFYNRFHLFFNSEDERFVEKWEKLSTKRIQDIATIHTGVRSKVGQKNIISKSQKSSTWKRGIISSSQIKPFFLDYQ
ncbi:MAG: N-6 DNA methylase, partial [Candidatus Heimdallarchaeota archaeon]|nr:N-6 DNA methylase [Candidatus Heimdallarchaeota archaeon]MCK4878925.1 N-6 DNA methylase [Candidatus Heimdallarchaeota archaeon]